MTNPFPTPSLDSTPANTKQFLIRGRPLMRVPLHQVTQAKGFTLIDALYHPDERFAQGFYRYRVDILKHPEKLAWDNTLEELEHYKEQFKTHYADPGVHTVGYMNGRRYEPVGIFCMRDLEAHERGAEILEALDELGASGRFSGSKAIVHSFSLLKDYRNLEMLKYIFVCIGLDAIQQGYEHIFFFMSDHRLKKIYRRYGLEFPLDLKFRNSQHVVGCFTLNAHNVQRIHDFIRS